VATSKTKGLDDDVKMEKLLSKHIVVTYAEMGTGTSNVLGNRVFKTEQWTAG